jgi:hypothetical protein
LLTKKKKDSPSRMKEINLAKRARN